MASNGKRAAGAGLLGMIFVLALAGAPVCGQAPAPKSTQPAKPAEKPKATRGFMAGDITVKSQQLNYDMVKRQVRFTGNVDLVSKTSHLTADRMIVDLTDNNELKNAHCEGNVFVERTNPETKLVMTARSKVLDYSETEQTANLVGDAVIDQPSPKLAKPAHITGDRVDMDLETEVNVVLGTEQAQAKVHLEPKGEEGKPVPEIVDLIGDRIEMNGLTQQYVATGRPIMKRPSSQLQAQRIRFQVDEMTNEVQVAYADKDVIVDSKSEDGSTMHATGDSGIYNKASEQITMIGSVNAETKKPDDPGVTKYKGAKDIYNQKSKISDLFGSEKEPATVIIPKKADPKPGAAPADAKDEDKKEDSKKEDGQKDAEKKSGEKKSEKPKKATDK